MHVKGGEAMGWTNSAETARFRAAMEDQQRKHLAKRIKELRLYKGWTEADLWHASGVSIQTISRLENAHTENPRENTLRGLAAAFKITRDDLAGPRVSPEEMDRAYESQLDDIQRKLEEILSRLPEPSPDRLAGEAEEEERALQSERTGSGPSGGKPGPQRRAPRRKRPA